MREPGLYPWSSHRNYLGARSQPWLTTGFALGMLASQGHRAVDRYCELLGMSAPLSWGSGALTLNRSQPQILGDDAFVARATAPLTMPAERITLAQLLDDCSARFSLSAAEICSPRISRKLAKARAWLAHQATRMGVASISDVARFLGRSEGAIRQAMQRHSLDALEA